MGILNHPAGHIVLPHIHNLVERNVKETQEMLYVEKGEMKITFFREDEQKIGEEIIRAGEFVLLMRKGHGMEMLKDSKIIYVKQGPYVDKNIDKRVF
jgi:hypothetical protein